MSRQKIKSLAEIAKISKKLRGGGKTIGLITGCFDILHVGHMELFDFAKSKCDVVIVGIENDKSIKMSKGSDRPFNTDKNRARLLSALENVNYVFLIRQVYEFGSAKIQDAHLSIYALVNPTYLVTNPLADLFWKKKRQLLKKTGGKILLDRRVKKYSSTKLLEKINKNAL